MNRKYKSGATKRKLKKDEEERKAKVIGKIRKLDEFMKPKAAGKINFTKFCLNFIHKYVPLSSALEVIGWFHLFNLFCPLFLV